MQQSILSFMRTLKLMEGCKSTQIYGLNSNDGMSVGDKLLQNLHDIRLHHRTPPISSTTSTSSLLPYGLPLPDSFEPQINPFLTPHNYVATLSSTFQGIQIHEPNIYLQHCAIFHDPKLFRRSLQLARHHARTVHDKIVLASWLRYDRREDELIGKSSMECSGWNIECPQACLLHGRNHEIVMDRCCCNNPQNYSTFLNDENVKLDQDIEPDLSFYINGSEVSCVRYNIACLSKPLHRMLYGGFAETIRTTISFSQNNISLEGMKSLEIFSRIKTVKFFKPNIVLELLTFANMYCCEEMKSACDDHLASLVDTIEDASLVIDYGLEETAYLLVAACLQVFLRELPNSLQNISITKIFCSVEGCAKLHRVGHSSFLLYYFLSQVSMDEDFQSNTTVMLLERMVECADEIWQKQLGYHQLGVVMLERKEYKDAQKWFELAVEEGHVYSTLGVSRAKFKRGHKYSAYKIVNSLISDNIPTGWMYQERSLYCNGKEKIIDLNAATNLDPTLSFPYKYRAIILIEENKYGAAISELNKILRFKIIPDCLELRAWILIIMEDYDGALRDVRALLTLEPDYQMFNGKMNGQILIHLLSSFVQQYSQAQCWMQLYDRWSSVDDIGSLSIVHQMLSNDPRKSLLQFRQSLLLLRLNCQKAAMRSLRLARNYSIVESERLVYEGWILYDTGHREGALEKAENSIKIQRSFEAFFLKAYVLADSTLDSNLSNYVIHLLKEALKCPSDGLRKGQALNNLGSVYVECNKLELAADCFINALNIKHTRAHQGLARVYHLKNQRKCAYDEMTKLIEKARNNASAYEKRSEYCDRDMAKSDLAIVTQLDPLRTYPYRYRAAVLMDEHKEMEALAELSRVIFFKLDFQLLNLRATFYDSLGDVVNTICDCQAALCLEPCHIDTHELYKKACMNLRILSKDD